MMWSGVLVVLYGALHGIDILSVFALLTLLGMWIDRKEGRERWG
ncbi:hypothetical protein [Exiguobacterium sp. NG55]|nr:hypothetical protein [Exiguobacterium sp. NG55]